MSKSKAIRVLTQMIREAQDPCRTEDCDGDPNDGDSYDGYCPSCADRIYGD